LDLRGTGGGGYLVEHWSKPHQIGTVTVTMPRCVNKWSTYPQQKLIAPWHDGLDFDNKNYRGANNTVAKI